MGSLGVHLGSFDRHGLFYLSALYYITFVEDMEFALGHFELLCMKSNEINKHFL